MKKLRLSVILTCAAILATCLSFSGCCYPEAAVTDALKSSWDLLKPATEFGIQNNPALDTDSKITRLRVVAEFTELIDEMYKQSQKED